MMWFQQSILVYFFVLSFPNVVPPVDASTKAVKRAKFAEAASKFSLQKETRPVRTEFFPIEKDELVSVWNKIFPKNTFKNPTINIKTNLRNIAIPYGEQLNVENALIKVSKVFKENGPEFLQLKVAVEAATQGNTTKGCDCAILNLALGYCGKQTIYFKPNNSNVIAALEKKVAEGKKLYGMECTDDWDEADFEGALEVVFGKGGEIIFEGIEVDWNQSNYLNFKDHIEEESQNSIKEDETDPKLIALKKAIDVYNLDKRKDNLQQIAIEWLRKLKGSVTFPKKVDSTKPEIIPDESKTGAISEEIKTTLVTTEVIAGITETTSDETKADLDKTETILEEIKTTPVVDDKDVVKSDSNLGKLDTDSVEIDNNVHPTDYNSDQLEDLIEKDSDLPSLKKNSISLWIILILIIGICGIIVAIVSIHYWKRKKRT